MANDLPTWVEFGDIYPDLMRLDEISLKNFRAKQAVSLPLGRRLTLLMGENGAGKTTILDAIAIACSAIFRYLPDKSNNVKGIGFRKGDILKQDGRELPYALIRAICMNNGPKWDLMRKRDNSKLTGNKFPEKREGFRGLQHHIEETIVEPWHKKEIFDLPVVTYYGVNRGLISVPQRRRNFGKNYSRFAALADSLNAISRFRSAFIWFYHKEDEERRLQQERRNFDVKLPELEAIRQCICELLPNTSNPRIAINPLRFLIKHHGQDLEIDQLSDGYKTVLGLAIDLGTRMATANPHMDHPLETEAIVLIDEVDLHLHPTWQQRVISDLLRTFPNTQFVLTSHSPILVESVNNLLKRHAIDHLLAKASPESIEDEVRNLYPLDPKDTKVYDMTRSHQDSATDLMDQGEGLTGDTLIENFNEVSALFEDMRDFEDDNTSLSLEEDAP